jgi:hypothetical protein
MISPLGVLSEDCKFVSILDGLQTVAATDRTSDVIDTAGFGRCLIAVKFLTVHNSATQNIFLQSSDVETNETTLDSGEDVLGSSQVVAGTDDNKIRYIDFIPEKRFYQLNVNKDATNAGDECAFAILYHSKDRPVTHGAGTSTVGEGTAAVVGEDLGLAVQGTA